MKPSSMPDIAGAFRIRREMRNRKQDTYRVSADTNDVSRRRAEKREWKCPACGNGGVYISCDCGWIDAWPL